MPLPCEQFLTARRADQPLCRYAVDHHQLYFLQMAQCLHLEPGTRNLELWAFA